MAPLAPGMADNLLASVILAATIPVLVCPAMNSAMLAHAATQENIVRLRGFGYHLVEPASGSLACGESGAGRLPDWDVGREALLSVFAPQDLNGRRVLITAGPTREPIDPARYISNRSSGKMGYAQARTARRRGAEVTLISGPVSLPAPPGVKLIRVTTAEEMAVLVAQQAGLAEVIVKSAAVADFRPAAYQEQKIKKRQAGLALELVKNTDILMELGRKRRPGQLLVGFAAESGDHEAEGRRKLTEKNLDLIVVNDILGKQTGFDVETNQVTLIDKADSLVLPLLSKEDTADRIWDKVVALLGAAT